MGDCGRDIYVEYVSNELEKKVVEKVRKRTEEGGGLLIVKGAKGIGKSTAVQVALYRVLQLPLKVGDRYYKPVVVAVGEYGKDESEKFIHAAKSLGFYPIFYLDPSKPRAYPKEPPGLYQPEMSIEELRSTLDKLRDVTGAVAVTVLSNDQYQAVEDLVDKAMVIDADQLLTSEKGKYVEALVKNYSGCSGEVVERAANAIASQFADGYAVAAVLAADWLKRGGCRGEEVEKAIERANGDVHRFVLHYLWYGIFNGDEAVARRYAPLLLAMGFFGPHPPKLAKAVVRAFDGELEDAVVRWFSQPLHGALYEAIRKVAHGAVYRRFGVGSDELCQGGGEGPCKLVEICAEVLVRVPPKRYTSVVEIAEDYAKFVAKALTTPRPAGVRQVDFLIDDFLRAYNGVAEGGRWRIRYEAKGSDGVKVVEDVVDELDITAALYGLAVLPGWHSRLKPLEEWFFVGDKKVGMIGPYFYPLLRERGVELVKRAVTIACEVEKRGDYTGVDLLRAVGIAVAGQWDSATDEELEKAMELAIGALGSFATFSPIILAYMWPLLSETWLRIEDGDGRQRLADWSIRVAYEAARGHPHSLSLFLVVGVDKPDWATLAKRFAALYNMASNAGKLLLLDILLNALGWDIGGVNVAATLLGNPQLGRRGAFEEVAGRVKDFVSHLHGVEMAYVVASLYPLIAKQYASLSEFDKATEFAEESLKALEELKRAYEKDKALTEEELRSYLELKQIKPDLERELNTLSLYVYYYIAFVYMGADELDKAVRYAEKACELARKLGFAYYEVSSCRLLPRLRAVKDGVLTIKEFGVVAKGIAGRCRVGRRDHRYYTR